MDNLLEPQSGASAGAARPTRTAVSGSIGALGRFAARKPLGFASLVVVIIVIFVALFPDLIAPFNPQETHAVERLSSPNSTYIMGTDGFGRDVFSRIVHGARTSVRVSTVSVLIGVAAGTLIGLLSGYWAGRPIDHLLQRLIDIQMSVPAIVLALAILTATGRGIGPLTITIAIVFIPTTSRVLRGSVLSLMQSQYIDAARCLGCSTPRIMARHILPNVMAPIIVLATAGLGNALLVEGTLSFLGYGPPPPTPTWGGMLSGENRTLLTSAPWLALFPGVAISLMVFSFNLLGDALRDTLDPRLRGSR